MLTSLPLPALQRREGFQAAARAEAATGKGLRGPGTDEAIGPWAVG
jgi:hypothetical protein